MSERNQVLVRVEVSPALNIKESGRKLRNIGYA
jgi:hypothetical protein